MKKTMLLGTVYLALLVGPLVVIPVACTTNQQKITFNSLYTVEKGVTGSFDSYMDLVIAGKLKTNDVPKVSKQYNEVQRMIGLAVSAAQFNTNAPPPANVVSAATGFLTTVATVKKGGK